VTSIALCCLSVLAGCTGGGPAQPSVRLSDSPGGLFRTAVEDFGFSGAFDPTGEYAQLGLALQSQLLVRTLVTYRHVAGPDGNELVPDLARSMPAVSDDGLTYTFHLRPGIKFGPPVDREITSADIEYAFERIDTKELVAQYGFYYDGTIEGMHGPVSGGPGRISGIGTPDPRTIVFHLERPAGDFLYRLALPATGPIPPEIGRCFPKAGDYGRDLIATGPYMIEGEDRLDVSGCGSIEPIDGFDPTRRLLLVRNPNYVADSSSAEGRTDHLDGVSILIDKNADDIFEQIESGDLDGSLVTHLPAATEQRYLTDPKLAGLLHSDSTEAVNFVVLNLLVPPFDDVHVRRAVNDVADKSLLQRAWGGRAAGDVATHLFPPTLLPGFPAGYDPYPSPGHRGNLAAAKEEMRRSRYDHDHDGVCDDAVCSRVVMVTVPYPPYDAFATTLQGDFHRIGIDLRVRELGWSAAFAAVQDVGNLVPMAGHIGWAKDIPDPFAYVSLFSSSGIRCEGQVNVSEVGMTAAQARECGILDDFRDVGAPPSVDGRAASCEAMGLGPERSRCWIDLDRYLMEDVVPWIPYQWVRMQTVVAPTVTHYEFDQNSDLISLCRIAVDNGIDPGALQ
jgi:peptide/nickel transport system substrate-binding protein